MAREAWHAAVHAVAKSQTRLSDWAKIKFITIYFKSYYQAFWPSLSPRVSSNPCPLSWWCYLTISCCATLFSFWIQAFPESGSFPMSCLFPAGGQSTGASTSASVLSMNIQGLFPLGLTGLMSFLCKGLSSIISSTAIQKHQLFQVLSLIYGPNHTSIHDYWINHRFDCMDICWQVMPLVFDVLPRFLIAFFPRSKYLFFFNFFF